MVRFPNCQQFQAEHLQTGSLTQIIEGPTLKGEAIYIDFVVCIPRTRRYHDSIWVILDMIVMSAHFIHVKSTYMTEDYVRLYIDKIVRWHGIPMSIISDRGA